MVTKRARTWLRRGTAAALALLLLATAVGIWLQTNALAADWLSGSSLSPLQQVEIVTAAGDRVTLTATPVAARPGVWGLDWDDGYAVVGDVIAEDAAGVHRPVLSGGGRLRAGLVATLDEVAWDPRGEFPVPVEEVIVDASLGDLTAWSVPGAADTWVILVHGAGADRSQMVRLLPTIHRAGFPILVPMYRNDDGAPRASHGRHGYGYDEWRDLDAFVEFALDGGAADVVLVGVGSGGSIVAAFLAESVRSDAVSGIVLDSPILDLAGAVESEWRGHNLPGFAAGLAKLLATFRFGIDWSDLDHVAAAVDWRVPVLVLQGLDDEVALPAVETLALNRPDLVLLITFPGAGFGWAWNSDPGRYEDALAGFLRRVSNA